MKNFALKNWSDVAFPMCTAVPCGIRVAPLATPNHIGRSQRAPIFNQPKRYCLLIIITSVTAKAALCGVYETHTNYYPNPITQKRTAAQLFPINVNLTLVSDRCVQLSSNILNNE